MSTPLAPLVKVTCDCGQTIVYANEGTVMTNNCPVCGVQRRFEKQMQEAREYEIKDSGQREKYSSGAMRDTEEGKLDWSNLFVHLEPMGTRYVQHMTKGRKKYPDPEPGVPNWTLFEATPEMLARTLRSFDRHVKAYRMGLTDEDHAAAIIFNLNLAEKIREALDADSRPSVGSPTGP